MFDTNLWSSIGREMVVDQFNDLMKARSFELVMAPSTLLEVIRTPVAETRQRIIHALATGHRRRLPTEAQMEADELVSEIRRVRPQWLRQMSDTAKVVSLNNFWTNRIWREAVHDSQRLHDYEKGGAALADFVVARQKEQRMRFLEANANLRPLTALVATPKPDSPDSYLAGWSGKPVEVWRMMTRDIYWFNLIIVGGRAVVTGEDSTIADWVGAYVNLNKMRSDRADFTRFWIDDVELTSMRRHWLRNAVWIVQANYKVGHGNPADEQHSAYLVDCDMFLSADARYISTLEIVRADSPFAFAEPRLVAGNTDIPVLERIGAVL